MCKIAAYMGPTISLGDFISAPENSLYKQSTTPRELTHEQYNADGYGFGWYRDNKPHRYVNSMPIWNDPNLSSLGKTLHAPLWIGFTRNATSGGAVGTENTQPFHDEFLHFTHSGFIASFNRTLKPNCLRYISAPIAETVEGTTDSEYLFALLRQRLLETESTKVETALLEILATLDVTLRDVESELNIVISDGRRLIASRHATNTKCQSLHYSIDDEFFPSGAQMIASEPLTSSKQWKSVPEHHILILSPNKPPDLMHI